MLTPLRAWLVVAVVVAALHGCGGDDREDKVETPIDGTFVGTVSGTSAFVAVSVTPPTENQERREVTVYVSDGSRLSKLFSGTATGNASTVTSDDEAEAKAELTAEAATGTLQLPDGKTARYTARRATAAAGLYNLAVASNGRLTGASAAGVALEGTSTLPEPGGGTVRLADGTRLKFQVRTRPAGAVKGLDSGEVRLIVLPDRRLRGAGRNRSTADGGDLDIFLRSSK